ncbi:flavoprotein, partial [Klebsiella pneumoniae]
MNVILGVSGSVAAYRAADLARELMRRGHTVRVCLTDSAQNFVRP